MTVSPLAVVVLELQKQQHSYFGQNEIVPDFQRHWFLKLRYVLLSSSVEDKTQGLFSELNPLLFYYFLF